jgi:hypothetical protein
LFLPSDDTIAVGTEIAHVGCMTEKLLADSSEQAEVIEELDHTWDSRLKAIEQAIGTLQGVVSTLKADVSSFKKDVSSLQKDMTIVRAGINILLARPQR